MPRLLRSLLLLTLMTAGCRSEGVRGPEDPVAGTAVAPLDSGIVALGASVTETLYALGLGDAIVAVDASSVYPPEARNKAKAGYYRALSAEPILSLAPRGVLADPNAGPPAALDQLRAAGVRVEVLPGGSSVDSVAAQIVAIGRIVGREAQARALADSLLAQVFRAGARLDTTVARPRVLFVQAQAPGVVGLAGRGTNAHEFIQLAGGANVLADHDGYRNMTPEAVAEAAPEVIVLTERTLGEAGGANAFLARPGVAQTPAAQARRLIVVPDAAMNFGPSFGAAVLDLAAQLRAR